MAPDPVTAVFAANLRRLRAERSMSRPVLAGLAGVHYETIRLVEEGGVSPRLTTAGRIAAALGSTVADMLAPAEVPPS